YLGKKSVLSFGAYLTFSCLLLLTHIFGLLIIAAQLVFLVIECWQTKRINTFLSVLPLLIICGILAFPIYFKLLYLNLFAVISGSADTAFAVFPWYLKIFLILFVLSLGETVAPWNLLVVLPAGIVFGSLLLMSFSSLQDNRIRFLLIMLFFPILTASIFLKPTMPKYLIICLPYYLLLISNSIAQMGNKAVKYGVVTILIFVQCYSIYNYFSLQEYHNSNQIEPWRQVGSQIESQYRKGDIVLTTTHFVVYRLLNYYLNVIGKVCAPIFDLEQVKCDIAKINSPRVWLVANIHDDRAFPPGHIDAVKAVIGKKYALGYTNKYIPYEETLVSKLPINRHKTDSCRIDIGLYQKR
ncbi:MAG: hypothetical protein QME05_03970, partial [Candidatus Margulisbacteria bacterium]|nr:hypothetical protein [Candidatus Margulisiibacteriota bacterium]